MSRYDFIHAAFTAIIAAITTLTVSGWNENNRSRELDIKIVELAVQILREENDKDGKLIAAKGWAVDIINAHSPSVKISDAAKAELVARPLAASPFSTHQKNEQSDGAGSWIYWESLNTRDLKG